ncbi:hypothetical protein MBLNU459_g7320t1 [Dothideomycetes sp. NU459]
MTTGSFDIHGDRSDLIIIVNVVLAFCTLMSLVIRFARPNNQSQVGAQSFMLCLAAFCGVMMSLLQCVATKYGLGARFSTLQPAEIEKFLKINIFIMSFYMACNAFVKLALLSFYKHLTYERYHHYAIWFMEFVAVGFGLSSILVVVMQCLPITKLWHRDQPGSCVDVLAFLYSNALIMIGNDIVLYIMPVVFTWKLELRLPQRIVLNLLFALGLLVVATSFIRLWVVYRYQQDGDVTYNMATCLLWSAIENHMAIFIACTPSIKALVAGTLLPMVSSSYEGIREKIKRSSMSGSNGGFDSSGAAHSTHTSPLDTATSAPVYIANKMLHQFRGRSHSIASNDSGLEHIVRPDGTPFARKNSDASIGSSYRTYSKSSMKDPNVTVYAMDNLSPPRLGHLPSCPDLEAQAQVQSPAQSSRFSSG